MNTSYVVIRTSMSRSPSELTVRTWTSPNDRAALDFLHDHPLSIAMITITRTGHVLVWPRKGNAMTAGRLDTDDLWITLCAVEINGYRVDKSANGRSRDRLALQLTAEPIEHDHFWRIPEHGSVLVPFSGWMPDPDGKWVHLSHRRNDR